MAAERTQLILGRGELYFDMFAPDTNTGIGELYLGNTPEFSTSSTITRLDVFDSFDGQKVLIGGEIIREQHTGRFTTDNISRENLALWYGGAPDAMTQVAQESLIQSMVVYRGRYYQIGASLALPFGRRGIDNVVVTGMAAAGNYEVDRELARIRILPDAVDISDGETIVVSYEMRSFDAVVITSKRRDMFGALRYIERNAVGINKNIFYPCVRLSTTGDIDHKSDNWQVVSFEFDALRRNPLLEYVYIDELTAIGGTVTENAIIDIGGITIEMFPYWENQLNNIVNVQMSTHYD